MSVADPGVSIRDQWVQLRASLLSRVAPLEIISEEHGVDVHLLHHQAEVKIPAGTTTYRLVLWHPVDCGCDALTNDFVLHG